MADLKEKVAYLRGLIDGSDGFQDDKTKRIWDGLLGFCDEVAQEVGDLEESHHEFVEYVEAIDEDLSSLEKHFYPEGDEDDEIETMTADLDGDDTVEMACPNCKEILCFEDEPGNYEVVCPECGQVVWNHFEMNSDSLQSQSQDVI